MTTLHQKDHENYLQRRTSYSLPLLLLAQASQNDSGNWEGVMLHSRLHWEALS